MTPESDAFDGSKARPAITSGRGRKLGGPAECAVMNQPTLLNVRPVDELIDQKVRGASHGGTRAARNWIAE